jgi:hypothetical protein
MFTVLQCIPPVVSPHYWGRRVRYFPPEVGISSLVCRVVCCYEPDPRVVLVGCWYVSEFVDREPLPVAPSQVAGACRCEKEVESDVTAKTATPTKVDSKLSDAHLESLKRREGEGECH